MPATDSPVVVPAADPNVSPDDALLNATIVERQDLTGELAVVKVRLDAGDVADYKPGQYATLGVPPVPGTPNDAKKGLARLLMRPYSVSSSPRDRSHLEFYLALVQDGACTPQLWKRGVGERVWMTPKCKGTFTLDGVPNGMDLVTVATGTGLAPFVSMLKTFRETGRWRRFVVIHGTRLCGDLGYRAELEELASQDESVVYLPTCSREPEASDWRGFRGRVNGLMTGDALERHAGVKLDPSTCHVLLCGNPAMIDEAESDLAGRGFVPKDRDHPDGNLHFERYW